VPSSKVEDQLSKIKDKEDLYRYIDELPEDARVFVIVDSGNNEDYRYKMIGDFPVSELVYMCEVIKWDLFDKGSDDEE
jgi:hypothetical protein